MTRKQALKQFINLVLKNFKQFKVYKNNYVDYLITWDKSNYLTIKLKNNKYNFYDTFGLFNEAFELLNELCKDIKYMPNISIVKQQVEYINNLK